MRKNYDLIVIGTGTAASTVAFKVRAAGRSVAVIDFRPFGGTCALRGCDPKKMMIGGARAVDHATLMRGKGVTGDVAIDWPGLLDFKRSFTDPVPAKKEQGFAAAGIDSFNGRAHFVAPDAVEVDGKRLEARNIVIASGAEPVPLGIEGEEHLIDSEAFLNIESLPQRILLVGGGYIAAEFSHIAARAGAKVTILQRGSRILDGFDPDLVGWMMEKFAGLGVDVRTDTGVTRVEKRGDGYVVTAVADGEQMIMETDLVVHAAGRKPDLASLDLAAGGIEVRNGRIALNDHLQSVSNPAVYVAGDAAQMGPPLTPVANHEGKVVTANLLEGNRRKPNYEGVPSVVFTIPPLASVGLSEEEARAKELSFRVTCERTSGWFTARQAAETVMGHKVLIEDGSGRILGAHLIGPHADEVINIFALAVRHGLSADQLAETMFAYPTGASDISSML